MPTPADRPALAASRRLPAHELDPRDRHGGRIARLLDNLGRLPQAFDLLLGSAVVAVLGIVAAIRNVGAGPTDAARRRTLELALCGTIYRGGLVVLVVEERYLYLPMLIGIALGAKWVDGGRARPGASAAPLYLVAATTIVGPIEGLASSFERSTLLAEVHRFVGSAAGDLAGARIASLPPSLGEVGSVCFVEGCTYLGAPRPDVDEPIAAQLDRFGVDVFVAAARPGLELPGYERVALSDGGLGRKARVHEIYRAVPRGVGASRPAGGDGYRGP